MSDILKFSRWATVLDDMEFSTGCGVEPVRHRVFRRSNVPNQLACRALARRDGHRPSLVLRSKHPVEMPRKAAMCEFLRPKAGRNSKFYLLFIVDLCNEVCKTIQVLCLCS